MTDLHIEKVLKSTKKALLVEVWLPPDRPTHFWIPRSAIQQKQGRKLVVEDWVAEQEGLV